MLVKDIEALYFSQSALKIYRQCPLRFRYRYLDGLFWPKDWGGNQKQRLQIEKGRLFHLLAQRYYSGLETSASQINDPELNLWFERLKSFCPYNSEDYFYPEHELRLNQAGLKLLAKYDLLFLDRHRNTLTIYDWKTNQERLAAAYGEDLQTTVYLFVLAAVRESSFVKAIPLEEIKLIYFNPRYPQEVKSYFYSQAKYRQDREVILQLIKEIKSLDREDFQGVNAEQVCNFCEYRPLCFGKRASQIILEEEDLELELDWELLEEGNF